MLVICTTIIVILAIVVSYVIPQLALFEIRNSISTTPKDAGMASENVTIRPSDRPINLYGWWLPASNPLATFVFFHGATSNRHSEFFNSVPFYKALVENQMSVFTIDLRNHGESDADGQGLGFGRSEANDVAAAVSWAKTNFPDRPIFAMGISMGSAAIIHAQDIIDDLAGIILLDPVLHSQSAFCRGAGAQTGAPWPLFLPSAYIATWLHQLPFKSKDALSSLLRIEKPILLIQDTDDPITIAKFSRIASKTSHYIEYWETPKLAKNHPLLINRGGWGSHVGAYNAYPKQTLDMIMGFVIKNSRDE